jgi:hypothetical protein
VFDATSFDHFLCFKPAQDWIQRTNAEAQPAVRSSLDQLSYFLTVSILSSSSDSIRSSGLPFLSSRLNMQLNICW